MIGKKTTWTPQMIKYLQNNYQVKTNLQLAGSLGLTLTVVRNKLYELGLARYSQKERAWTNDEDVVLRSLYTTTGDVDISKQLNRTKGGVRKRRVTLGLVRTIAQIQKIVANNMIKLKPTEFKCGQPSKCNPAKAWATRRKRDNQTTQQIIGRIQHREKANFYRV